MDEMQVDLTPKFGVGQEVAVQLHAVFHGVVREVDAFPDRVVYGVYITNRDAVKHNILEGELMAWRDYRP